ncbi:MAG: hypothetical protein R3233_09585, partial [Xanthomonadales bacterium]|nr:hypothetical protein [Xanthomonadales bacterium]
EATRPAPLARNDAEQMLQHVAADVRALLPDVADCSLIAAGALYDQTQVLRPGFPVFEALEATAADRSPKAAFRPTLVSIGSDNGKMPDAALQPDDAIPLGLLQLLPVVVHGPAGTVEALGRAMEYRFLEEGQLSAHSALWLQTAFDIRLTHARLMTLTDLSAMLRMQLDHFGFLPLWELLDAALSGQPGSLAVTTPSGKAWEWRGDAVHTRFETFDHWANEGGGAGLGTARMALAGGYGDWTREVRQYLSTLRAHRVPVRFHLPDADRPLEGTFFRELSPVEASRGDATVTHHSFGDLGTVAVTAVTAQGVENFYPLGARGLNDIQAHLRQCAQDGLSVAFPGTIVYDERSRRLRPDQVGDRAGADDS